jgi:hypothetical protein
VTERTTKLITEDAPLPYKAWWGLIGCAVLFALVLLAGPYSDGFNFVPDKGNFWYYWQRSDPTVWSRLSAWVPYVIHTVSIWYLIAQAKHVRPRYIFGLHWFNVWALGINAGFILLHIVQTKIFYDGLAQDVHEATSMMSVVLMLWLVLLMENRRRGLFFGKGPKFLNSAGDAVRRYHGYYFSWAIIYVFWYHPYELTSGHLAGFAYMFLLMLQGSLFFTRFHTNRWWTVFLEVVFVVHGAMVAYFVMEAQRGQPGPWSMFMFGGAAIFLITQMHGLGLSRRAKWIIGGVLTTIMAVFYWQYPETLAGLPRLPAIQYIGVLLMFIIVWALQRFAHLLTRSPSGGDTPAEAAR